MSVIQFLEQQQQAGQIGDYVSPSRLSLWLKCPLAFRKRYLEGLQSAPTPSLFVGKIVHSVLAHIYRLRIAGHTCTPDDMPRFVADAWKYTMEVEPCFFDEDEQEEKARYQVLGLVTTYLNSIPVQEERPVAIEKRYEVPLIDPMTDEHFGITLVGIADLILEEEGGYVITDFKTAATSALCDMQHELQLTAYAYLVRNIIEQDELRCEVRQLVKTKSPKVNVYTFPV